MVIESIFCSASIAFACESDLKFWVARPFWMRTEVQSG